VNKHNIVQEGYSLTIRVFAIAAILFLLIALTDKHKPMIKKCGRISVALVVLFANMIVDMGMASAFANWLHLDQLFIFIRDVVYAFGLSGTALISIQVYALSALAMFTLLYLDCKASICINKQTHVVECVSQKDDYHENQSNLVGFFNHSCVSAKRLN